MENKVTKKKDRWKHKIQLTKCVKEPAFKNNLSLRDLPSKADLFECNL